MTFGFARDLRSLSYSGHSEFATSACRQAGADDCILCSP